MGKTSAPNVDIVLSKLRAELRRRAGAAGIQLPASRDRKTLESRGDPGIFSADEWQEQLALANALASQLDANEYMRQRMHWTAPGFGEANFKPVPRSEADDIAVALWRLGSYWLLECNLGTLRSVLDAAREAVEPIRALNQAVRDAGASKVESLLAQRIRSANPEDGARLIVENMTAAVQGVQELDRIFSQFFTDGSPWDDLLGASKIAADSAKPFWTRSAKTRQIQAVTRTRESLLAMLDDKTIAQLTDDGNNRTLRGLTNRVSALRSDLGKRLEHERRSGLAEKT